MISKNDFIQIFLHNCFFERDNVVYVRHLVWSRPVFEAQVDGLHDAEFAVEQRERLYVHCFATDETDGFLADDGLVLKAAAVHFEPGRRPCVHDAAEGTPKVFRFLDTDNRLEAINADDVLVRVARLAVHN